MLLGAGAFLDRFGDALDTRAAAIVRLLPGVGLFALSFRFDSKRAARKAAQSDAAPSAAGRPDAVGPARGPVPVPVRVPDCRAGRRGRPRARGGLAGGASVRSVEADAVGTGVVRTRSSVLPLMGLALGAVAIEVGTMCRTSPRSGCRDVGRRLARERCDPRPYCVVMVAPALLLLLGRLARRVRSTRCCTVSTGGSRRTRQT